MPPVNYHGMNTYLKNKRPLVSHSRMAKITINNFVTSGPYVPKFDPGDKDSTWQLNYKYNFFLSGRT